MEEGHPACVGEETMADEAPVSTSPGDKLRVGLRACRRGIGMEEGRPTYVRKESRAAEAHTTIRVMIEGGAPCVVVGAGNGGPTKRRGKAMAGEAPVSTITGDKCEGGGSARAVET